MVSGRYFDNGWRRAQVPTGYEHGARSGLLHSINEWPRSLVRKLIGPNIAVSR